MTDTNANTADLKTNRTALEIDGTDLFERVMRAGIDGRALEIITLDLPDARPGLPETIEVAVKHGENGPEIVDVTPFFEAHRTAPERRRGTAQTTVLQSFIDLVVRHKDEHSAIFAQTLWPKPQLTAVIDYHETTGTARYGAHRVEYAFPVTPEFTAWMNFDGVPMAQGDFALFLENHAAELAAPCDGERAEFEPLFKERFAAPNELIDLSRSLEISVASKIKRQERLQTGERTIVFESEHMNAQGSRSPCPASS